MGKLQLQRKITDARRATRWTFTILGHADLNMDMKNVKYVRAKKCKQRDGTLTWQGFIGMKNTARPLAIKKALNRTDALIHPSKGRFTVSEITLSKAGPFDLSEGDLPTVSAEAGSERWDKAKEVVDLDGVDALKDIDFELYLLHGDKLQTYYNKSHRPDMHNAELHERNEWICGPLGTGKTRSVHEMYPLDHIYYKRQDNLWDDYENHPIVLIDDVQRNWQELNQLPRWADRYPFLAKSDTGALGLIRPDRIIVTSNFSIDELTKDDPDLRIALKRRFFEIYMTAPCHNHSDLYTVSSE